AQDAHGGGLAGAVRSQKAENLAGPGVEADVIDGQHLPAAQVAKGFREVVDVDHGAPPCIRGPGSCAASVSASTASSSPQRAAIPSAVPANQLAARTPCNACSPNDKVPGTAWRGPDRWSVGPARRSARTSGLRSGRK